MDNRQTQMINEAAKEFAGAIRDSLRTVSGRSKETQERVRTLTQNFFESANKELQAQAESNRATAGQLTEQTRKQREAIGDLSRESLNAYKDFLNRVTSYHQTNLERAQGNVQEGARMASESTERAATSMQVAAEGHPGVPISDYDEMNVGEVSTQLEGLSEDELSRVRDYETQNKNRRTVIEEIDRKMADTP
ncbi:MAG: hypothetical protein WA982_00915 [Rubrobacteraceae bacterium]